MKDLQLVGYTADLLHLVFTDAGESGGRLKAPLDEDFVATLTEVLQRVDPDAHPLAALVSDEQLDEQSQDPVTSAFAPDAPSDAPSPNGDAPPDGHRPPDGERAPRGEGPLAGMAAAARAATDEEAVAVASDRPRPSSLAPREIQSLLRAGQGIRAVAKQADTDEWWVRRWLPPIEAERDQVLQAVWSSFVAKSRLGVSAEPIAEAVERNLASKGVGPDDPSVEWTAARREGDPHWQVTLRYRSRGRAQRATWHFNPETGALDPRNDLAVDVAWTRTRKRVPGAGSGARSANRRAAGRKAASAKGGAARKKSGGKKSGGSKSAKKAAAKKAAAKKAAAKKA
ncbi:MAG: septation protein SepH, partial [Egibacteraceae bacterium]